MEIPTSHAAVDRVTEYKMNEFPLLTIGRFSYIDGKAIIRYYEALSRVLIGAFCSVATGVQFFLRANHHLEWISTYPLREMPWPADVPKPAAAHSNLKGDIVLGHDVWVGEGVRFMPGVRVDHGAAIGAGTVVTKDVPAYSLFAGNPGRVRRMRFADADIEFLLRLSWWDWPTERIRRFAPLISSPNIAELRRQTADEAVHSQARISSPTPP